MLRASYKKIQELENKKNQKIKKKTERKRENKEVSKRFTGKELRSLKRPLRHLSYFCLFNFIYDL